MDYDIIFYAVIAVLILVRLWSVLGQRNSEDRERPNPFAEPPVMPDAAAVASPRPEAPLLLQPQQPAPTSLAGGLAEIHKADPAFDEKQFLQGARAAFTLIINDFTKGDLAESTRLLAPAVLAQFRDALEARHTAGHVMEHKLVSIREAECAGAKLENGHASITVRFVSTQESILRDIQGHIVEGQIGQTEEITDLWTFARATTSTDPNWILVETRS